jgi:hypothetical protein
MICTRPLLPELANPSNRDLAVALNLRSLAVAPTSSCLTGIYDTSEALTKESSHIRRMAMEESQGSAFLRAALLEAGFEGTGNNQIQIDSKSEGPRKQQRRLGSGCGRTGATSSTKHGRRGG